MELENRPLIVIVGSTASGKSSCALSIAKKYSGVIVNADSRQVYRELSIGTAKPVFGRVADGVGYVDEIPHVMFDIFSPDEKISVSVFQRHALRAINKVYEQGKVPVLVGGTGYYVQSVVDNMQYADVEIDEDFRRELNAMSLNELHNQLRQVDPDAYASIQISNKRRVIRALERVQLGQADVVSGPKLFDVLQLGMSVERDVLIDRIDTRVDSMMGEGLVDEVRDIVDRFGYDALALDSIGYKEVVSFLKNDIDQKEMIELIKIHTRQYARRQKTWFSRDDRIVWIENNEEALNSVGTFLPNLVD